MKPKFENLMPKAHVLHSHIDTDWAEEHESEYDGFADAIEQAYAAGEITAMEHDKLALEAFYDYGTFYSDIDQL